MSDATANYPIGQKIKDGFGDNLLGQESWFPDRNYNVDGKTELSKREVRCVLAKMGGTAGVTSDIAPGSFVALDADGTSFSEVSDQTEVANGQVDPYLSADVAVGDRVWLIEKGPSIVTSGSSYSAGAALRTADGGKVETNTYSDHSAVGKAIEEATAADQKLRALVDLRNI